MEQEIRIDVKPGIVEVCIDTATKGTLILELEPEAAREIAASLGEAAGEAENLAGKA